jgi:biotin transport system substrate-specific component
MKESRNLAMPALSCLFAALISVGAYIALPLPGTPVPIVFQNFFVMLTALLLGPAWALVSVLLYLCLGAFGLPVFAGGMGGFARFLGPTGGYLIGYIPAVFVMGFISRLGAERRWWRDALAVVAGCAVVYACGLPWLRIVIKGSWEKAIVGGLIPFLPGDAIKTVLAFFIAGRLAPLVERVSPRRRAASNDQGSLRG